MSKTLLQRSFFVKFSPRAPWIILLQVHLVCNAAAMCRDERREGWRWASSFSYAVQGQKALNFEPIHDDLKTTHDTLFHIIENKKNPNICIAQINFTLSFPDNTVALATMGKAFKMPLQDHVFVSGANQAAFDGFKAVSKDDVKKDKKKPQSTPRKDKSHADNRGEEGASETQVATSENSVIEVQQGGKKSKQQKKRANDIHAQSTNETTQQRVTTSSQQSSSSSSSSGVPSYEAIKHDEVERVQIANLKAETDSFYEYGVTLLKSAQNNATRDELHDYKILVQPNSRFFLGLEKVFTRIRNRYALVPLEKQPAHGQIVYRWFEAATNGSHDPIVIMRAANSPHPIHEQKAEGKNAGKSESDALLFGNNEDSEQKLIFYLHSVTDVASLKIILYKLIKCLDEYYQGSVLYQERAALDLLFFCTSQCNEERNALRSTFLPRDREFEEQALALLARLIKVCTERKAARSNNDYELNKFVSYITEVYETFCASVHNGRQKIADNSAQAIWRLLPPASKNKRDEKLTMLEFVQKYAEAEQWNGNFIEKLKLARQSLFSHIQGLEIDQLILDFEKAVDAVLEKYQDCSISAVVLNIHSTNDACHICAPDIACESLLKNSFAEYFLRRAQCANMRYKRKGERPFFRIMYSCGNLRDDVRCSGCTFDKREEVVPAWGPPGEVAYFQHFMHGGFQEGKSTNVVAKKRHESSLNTNFFAETADAAVEEIQKEDDLAGDYNPYLSMSKEHRQGLKSSILNVSETERNRIFLLRWVEFLGT